MTYQVLTEIRARIKEGEAVLSPGQVIAFDPSKAERFVKEGKLMPISPDAPRKSDKPRQEIVESDVVVDVIWANPYKQGTPEARQASLMAVMEAVWSSKFQGIINRVLNGQAKLADFRQAVNAWEKVVKERSSQ